MRVIGIHADHPKIIADDCDRVMVLQDTREFLEGCAFFGLFDMRFNRHRPLGLRQPHQPEKQAQQFHIILALILAALQDFAEAAKDVLHL